MLISLNWIRDFVDLPADLDPRALAEKFTRTTAEVDDVRRIEVGGGLPDDWIIEIDNKSLTNRPDLWGHYGIAREIAALLGVALQPYPVTPIDTLTGKDLPQIPINIADSKSCPRYSAIVLLGVADQPAPHWMQLRLGHVGQRPIGGLVDLTNYIMLDLGQPMHAFDAAKVDAIEVNNAKDGERFRTLDGVERTLTRDDLMIEHKGRSVALAGVMGGAETEVTASTTSILLESANFHAATIRKTAKRLGLRSEASARFEKSLDANHTVLAIQRFVHLARAMFPGLRLTSRLSDAYPAPRAAVRIAVDARHVARTIGRDVSKDESAALLRPLGFEVTEKDTLWTVAVPSHRATGDCSIEADIVEELARRIGYHAIAPSLPRVTVRNFPRNAIHELEQRTLEYFSAAHGFHEVHDYIWYDAAWLKRLGVESGPCVELVNPAAEGCGKLRRTLVPGLLRAVETNRFHFPSLSLMEIGGVFQPAKLEDQEFRHLGIILAQKGRRHDDGLYGRMKDALAGWSRRRFGRDVEFAATAPDTTNPWEHPHRTAAVRVDGRDAGRISVVDVALMRRIDEHLAAWCIVWAEVSLSALDAVAPITERLDRIPPHPRVELDFSPLVPRAQRFDDVVRKLRRFEHPLLVHLRFVTAYEGDPKLGDRRSLTFRAVIGEPHRTLTEDDATSFRETFENHLRSCGYEMRTG